MPTTANESREYTTLDDERAVVKASFPRKIQHRNSSFESALPKDMVRFLNLNEQSAPVEPRLIKGTQPVVIDGPAIVLRPYNQGER